MTKSDEVILKVENLSKQYRLGLVGTGTLSHDLNRWWHRVRGKEDPYLKIGETNDRSQKGESEYVWALKDINFEVKRGEVLGIIGKNGAGKSTLLKILSKVTSPTTGSVKTRGRIASLLEVGTGFHGEMTGRENIYLNGAILGMTKREIASKIDEIIDFSGCARYIDTPVKRYSSGMTVRLAFAVAAFLEPDILIVDEVLAVGDAEFQKKAIGKMQDISSGEGRTVLFVSHNMEAILNICQRVILMDKGVVADDSNDINGLLEYYLNSENQEVHVRCKSDNFHFQFFSETYFNFNEDLKMLVKVHNYNKICSKLFLDCAIKDTRGNYVLHYKMLNHHEGLYVNQMNSNYKFVFVEPRLVPGEYSFEFYAHDSEGTILFWAENVRSFKIFDEKNTNKGLKKIISKIIPNVEFSIIDLNTNGVNENN